MAGFKTKGDSGTERKRERETGQREGEPAPFFVGVIARDASVHKWPIVIRAWRTGSERGRQTDRLSLLLMS